MTEARRASLKIALDDCEDESIEYTIQYMQDFANASHDEVMEFLHENRDK